MNKKGDKGGSKLPTIKTERLLFVVKEESEFLNLKLINEKSINFGISIFG